MMNLQTEQNHSHAWRGAWDRPMKLDENSLHPFTVARMTDHNVRGVDPIESAEYLEASRRASLERWENEGGSTRRDRIYG